MEKAFLADISEDMIDLFIVIIQYLLKVVTKLKKYVNLYKEQEKEKLEKEKQKIPDLLINLEP